MSRMAIVQDSTIRPTPTDTGVCISTGTAIEHGIGGEERLTLEFGDVWSNVSHHKSVCLCGDFTAVAEVLDFLVGFNRLEKG